MPPHRPQGHGQPLGANHIDLSYNAVALKAISDLQLGSCPQVILKVRQPSSLVYRPHHGVLPNYKHTGIIIRKSRVNTSRGKTFFGLNERSCSHETSIVNRAIIRPHLSLSLYHAYTQ